MSLPASHFSAGALSTRANARDAIAEVCEQVSMQLGGSPNIAFLFFSASMIDEAETLARETCRRLGTDRLLGCNGESIVGVRREIEMEPAVSLWAAKLPNTTIVPMHLHFERSLEGNFISGRPDSLNGEWPAGAFLVGLGEPYSFPTDVMLEQLNEERPGVPMVGGMASGADGPGGNRLICGETVYHEGAVAAYFHGGVKLRTVVSQGCRPIGRTYVITKAERNVIQQLGGKPAFGQLQELFGTLPPSEQALMQRGLHVGRVVSEYRERFEAGDFLIRNVLGIDPDSGAIAVGDYLRPGQTVQFHVRDAASADAELRQMLGTVRDDAASRRIGALLFSCNGRGTRMFPTPHHDATAIADTLGELPLAGFFAAGEIGPVGGRNFVHGFTACTAIFEEE